MARRKEPNRKQRQSKRERPAGPRLAAIILGAGQGTRMRSDLPKVLHPLCGQPMVVFPLDLATRLGADPIVLVVGHKAELVQAEVESSFGTRVRFAHQKEQLGTGHAVMTGMAGLESWKGRVLVLYGDVPLLRQETLAGLLAKMDQTQAPLVALTALLDDPTGYGRIVRDQSGRVLRVVEQKDATAPEQRIKEINVGIYVFDSAFLIASLARLSNKNAQGEYYLTDLVAMAAAAGGAETVAVGDPEEVLGANSREELARLDASLRARTARRLMKSGVTIVDPPNTYVGPLAEIGRDTVILPGVHIRGATKIGERCIIEVGSILDSAELANDVYVRPYSLIEEATVASGAIIGPFARLRPEAKVLEGAHVGNFVELKKTTLGKGAKANHLAYLGDAEIGEGANIGAGTITCNYDGTLKHTTRIGAQVFVGSNATLVAPLAIADGAYVAAGSTITDPVGKNALVFGRARQTEKPNGAVQVRAKIAKTAAAKKGDGKAAPARGSSGKAGKRPAVR